LIKKKINEFPEAYRMSNYEDHMSEYVA
jgi:predicted translin family RNA/ssDNA-binding protein